MSPVSPDPSQGLPQPSLGPAVPTAVIQVNWGHPYNKPVSETITPNSRPSLAAQSALQPSNTCRAAGQTQLTIPLLPAPLGVIARQALHEHPEHLNTQLTQV